MVFGIVYPHSSTGNETNKGQRHVVTKIGKALARSPIWVTTAVAGEEAQQCDGSSKEYERSQVVDMFDCFCKIIASGDSGHINIYWIIEREREREKESD